MTPAWVQYLNRPSRWARRRFLPLLLVSALLIVWLGQWGAIASETALQNRAVYSYGDSPGTALYEGRSGAVKLDLVDPFGQILGCGGNLLPNYQGFSVGLYHPLAADPTGTELGGLVSLTRTELPDNPNNGIPVGLAPNVQNSNPFFLTNADQGRYNFLFDPNRGQNDVGQVYLLVVDPPPGSGYQQRRVRIDIIGNTGGPQPIVRYRATSLDGMPVVASGATQVESTTVIVEDAERIGLNFMAFQLATTLCQSQPVQIIKTADRAVAQPGDTVIYRVILRNLSDAAVDQVVITDSLPLGFRFLPNSVRAELGGQPLAATVDIQGSTVNLGFDQTVVVSPAQVLSLVYGVQLTPDAVRGSGRNAAIATARRQDNGLMVRDGPSTHRLRIDPGLLSDCGTLIGRVFEDKNFDGEQQPGEPGIPHAVIMLDDGTRITTDQNGLFSLANVLPGYRTGTLDPLSIPGYQLAPNHFVRERNSPSRLVHLAPGGLVRMNFGVMPTAAGAGES
jgi:uncharacterized repeat protein (TIGR01451 family)